MHGGYDNGMSFEQSFNKKHPNLADVQSIHVTNPVELCYKQLFHQFKPKCFGIKNFSLMFKFGHNAMAAIRVTLELYSPCLLCLLGANY